VNNTELSQQRKPNCDLTTLNFSGIPNRKPNLVTSYVAQDGHDIAAASIIEALGADGFVEDHIRTYDYCREPYRFVMAVGYGLMTRFPMAFNAAYSVSDSRLPSDRIVSKFNFHAFASLREEFTKLDPPVVITTHFQPLVHLMHLRKEKILTSKVIAVVTDFSPHQQWKSDVVDVYAVATQSSAERLASLGVPEQKISITGIPISGVFKNASDEKLTVNSSQYLIHFGGRGVGPIEVVCKSLVDLTAPSHFVILAGRNSKRKDGIEKFIKSLKGNEHTFDIRSFIDTTEIAALMHQSKLVIGKAGGLVVSEALAVGKPLLMVHALGPHEKLNAELIAQEGAGCYLKPSGTGKLLQELNADQGKLDFLNKNSARIGRPDAAKDIASLIQKLAS